MPFYTIPTFFHHMQSPVNSLTNICDFRFRLIFLRPFCNRIQRYLIIAFSKFYFYINNTVRHLWDKSTTVSSEYQIRTYPHKAWKYGQYLYSTNTARVSLFPQNHVSTQFYLVLQYNYVRPFLYHLQFLKLYIRTIIFGN